MSTIHKAPLSYFVYSSLSFFAKDRGGELPGMWFVRALTELGREPAAIRQTLYRMEEDGELETRKVGRVKFYRPSQYARAEIDAGLAKIFAPVADKWDGKWTLVSLQLASRVPRERVVSLLAVMGFALLGNDVYVHPQDLTRSLLESIPESVRAQLVVMRAPLSNEQAGPALLRLWRIPELAKRYGRVIAQLKSVEEQLSRGITDNLAFRLRFEVVLTYLTVAWDDPALPRSVLPRDWPGEEARALAAQLYQRLLKPAVRHAEALLEASVPQTTE